MCSEPAHASLRVHPLGAEDTRDHDVMDTRGTHLLVEYRGCANDILDDPRRIEEALRRAAIAAGATIVGMVFHQFSPQGVSGVVVVQESHLSIHTWPEEGYAAVDFYTCGDCEPERAHELLVDALGASDWEMMKVARGGETMETSRTRAGAADDERAEVCS